MPTKRYSVRIRRRGQEVILARFNAESVENARKTACMYAPSSGAYIKETQHGHSVGTIFKKPIQPGGQKVWYYKTTGGTEGRVFESESDKWPYRIK